MKRLHFILLLLVLLGCESKILNFNATYQADGTFIYITNNDTFDYYDIDLKINDRYKKHVERIKSGQQYAIGFGEFADSEGSRFNLNTTVLQSLSMLAESDQGTGYKSWAK